MIDVQKITTLKTQEAFCFLWIDKLTLFFFFSIVLLSTLALCINHYYWHYPFIVYFAVGVTEIFLFLFLSTLGSFFWVGLSSRITQGLFYILLYHIIICMVMYATTAVQLTPFEPIDDTLVQMDRFLHYDAVKVLDWLSQHDWIRLQLTNVYNFALGELLLLPVFLSIRGEFYSLKYYFYFLLSTTLIGFTFYFFFPTMAPASVLESPYFLPDQHNTGFKFYQIHHYIKASSDDGGLISMPSFHIIWALLCQNSTRRIRWLWYLLLPVNLLVILSAVFLGWHYCVDFLGSVLVIGMAGYICFIRKKSGYF